MALAYRLACDSKTKFVTVLCAFPTYLRLKKPILKKNETLCKMELVNPMSVFQNYQNFLDDFAGRTKHENQNNEPIKSDKIQQFNFGYAVMMIMLKEESE